jgi:hypothetical protein
VGTGVRAGASVIDGEEAGTVGADAGAVEADACGRCVGATEPAASGNCCDAGTGADRVGPTERAGGGAAGEPRSAPDTCERELSLGTMTRTPTTTPIVAPMMNSRSCSIALSFCSKNATSRLPDPTQCALRLAPMIGPVESATA